MNQKNVLAVEVQGGYKFNTRTPMDKSAYFHQICEWINHTAIHTTSDALTTGTMTETREKQPEYLNTQQDQPMIKGPTVFYSVADNEKGA